MQLALLDPKQAANISSNALIASLAGSSVCITDAPCGAGAAAFALLSTVAELRAQRILPRLPLDVFMVGAELSEPARLYAAAMLQEIRPSLEAQAIFVQEEFVSWDVTDRLSNASLISCATIRAANVSQRLLVVANFNGFLERHGKRRDAEPQIADLFLHASGRNSVAIWIEPDMNRAVAQGGLFQWLSDKVSTVWKRFAKQSHGLATGETVSTCSARFRLPLEPSRTARVGFAVMRIDLVRSGE
jgi:hypothetical protein